MDELGQVAALLESFGAEKAQAEVMARQLLKRAEQVSAEKGVPKIEALADLLQLVKAGRTGETYERPDK